MTHFRKLSTAAAALTFGTMMSTSAMAQTDMTCADYNAMSAEDQLAAAQDWNAGREGLRDEERGDDETVATGEENVSDDVEVDGGREQAREEARGSDEEAVEMMAEYCAEDDSLNLRDLRHPTEDGETGGNAAEEASDG